MFLDNYEDGNWTSIKNSISRPSRCRRGEFPTGSPSLTYLDHDGITFTEVEESLAALAPAIRHLEGSLEVVAVDSIERKVTIRFSGPQKLKLAIEGSLLDHPKVDSVEFLYV